VCGCCDQPVMRVHAGRHPSQPGGWCWRATQWAAPAACAASAARGGCCTLLVLCVHLKSHAAVHTHGSTCVHPVAPCMQLGWLQVCLQSLVRRVALQTVVLQGNYVMTTYYASGRYAWSRLLSQCECRLLPVQASVG
jgi:hypothetical protein